MITFSYKNYRGEIRVRHVEPHAIEWLDTPGFEYEPGWFLTGFDDDKRAVRSFALSNIVLPEDKNFILVLW